MKNLKDLYTGIFHFLDENLPASAGYHNVEHTQYVIAKARLLAEKENFKETEIWLIETAALFHDLGYIGGAKEHEIRSCQRARIDLPEYGFTNTQIEKICGMIMATEIPQSPKNRYDKILADADLFYLASPQFKHFGDKLFFEFKEADPNLTEKHWHEIQIKFLTQHRYFTSYGKKVLEPLKKKNLEKLIGTRD